MKHKNPHAQAISHQECGFLRPVAGCVLQCSSALQHPTTVQRVCLTSHAVRAGATSGGREAPTGSLLSYPQPLNPSTPQPLHPKPEASKSETPKPLTPKP
eukprot:802753-Rhodomonas_salina.2